VITNIFVYVIGLPIASARNARKLETRRLGLTAPRLSALNAYITITSFIHWFTLQIHRLIAVSGGDCKV